MRWQDEYAAERARMVEEQIRARHIEDPLVLAAMLAVPRHRFVPPELRVRAYEDRPLPIGAGQTISQPYIVALMTALLHLSGGEVVLEVGTGSGYQAAVLARLCSVVHTVEQYPELARRAQQILSELSVTNVRVHTGDGSLGWPAAAPYQGILVTAAAPEVPPALLDQLDDGGRLVIPVGARGDQKLQVWRRIGDHFRMKSLGGPRTPARPVRLDRPGMAGRNRLS